MEPASWLLGQPGRIFIPHIGVPAYSASRDSDTVGAYPTFPNL
jgi:hypothetical protein